MKKKEKKSKKVELYIPMEDVISYENRRCDLCPDETETCKKLYVNHTKGDTLCVESANIRRL